MIADMDAALEVLQYPIGRFDKPRDPSPADVAGWIEELAAAPAALRAAVAGLTAAQLDTPYREGGWTLRQVVHHVADSHINGYVRIRLALTEETPTVRGYDQPAWGELADARREPVETSLALLDGLHARIVALARTLTPDELKRGYVFPDRPRTMAVDTTLAMYAWHSQHHTAHVTGLRQRMGW